METSHHLSDLSRFMVASEDCDSLSEADLIISNISTAMVYRRFGVKYLESDQEGDSLHTVVSSVHIISHEEIIGVGTLPSDPEELHQVMKLAVNIPTHRHRTFHL